MSEKMYIYALICPKTGKAWYVGMSNNPSRRYKEHVDQLISLEQRYGRWAGKQWTSCLPMDQWIFDLFRENLRPELVILDEAPKEEIRELEKVWINTLLQEGQPLTNTKIDRPKTNPQLNIPHELTKAFSATPEAAK